jgi:exopolysaccharide biosynthesis operon protein EpsL
MAHSDSGFSRRAAGASGSAIALFALLLPTPSWALWGDRLELFASENVTYDSNVFRISSKLDPVLVTGTPGRSDTVSTTSLGFLLNVPFSLQRFEMGYTWYTSRYNNFSDLNHDGRVGRAALNWAITSRLTGDVGYQEQQVLANFANIQDRRPDLVTTRMAFANGAWMVTPSWRVHSSLNAGQTDHQDPELAIRNDIENVAVEAGLSYVSAQENRIGVAARSERGRSPHEVVLFGAPFDNAYHQESIGIQGRWVVTGLSRFDGRVDYTRREYDQLKQRNYSGPTGRLTYTYFPTGKITIAATAQRDVAPLEDISASFVLVTGVTVRPDWAITEKVSLRGAFAYNVWDYRGDPALGLQFTHRVRSAGASVMYRPTTHISLTAGVSREVRTSTAQFGDYEVTTASVEARVGF